MVFLIENRFLIRKNNYKTSTDKCKNKVYFQCNKYCSNTEGVKKTAYKHKSVSR